jgi:hypothetical protein
MTPLSHYRFAAEVDWIKVRFSTRSPTNFQMIRRHLPQASRVDAIEQGPSGAATAFVATIQDPGSWRRVDACMQRLCEVVPLGPLLNVAGIEVSLDAYSKSNSRADIIQMAATFYKGLTNPVSDNHRFSGRYLGDAEGIPNSRTLQDRLSKGRVICIGNVDDDLMQRIYAKDTDNGGKVALPVTDHRARIEIRVQGAALPAHDWVQWGKFEFQSLKAWFKFRRIRDDLSPVEQLVMDHAPQVGVGGHGRRRTSRMTEANVSLNRKAYDALRRLTDKM